MIATQKQKRVVGALVLLFVFCISAPFLVTGRNVNAGSTAVSKMTDRKSPAISDYDRGAADKDEAGAHAAPAAAEADIYAGDQQSSADPIIVDDAPKQTAKEPAKPIPDAKIAETKKPQSEAPKSKEPPKKETKEQPKAAQTKTPVKQDPPPKAAQSKQEPPKPAAKETPKQEHSITVIDTKNDQRQEIKVVSREEASKAASEKEKSAGKAAVPASRPGERYSVRVGVFSSITAAKNIQAKIGSACPGAMVKPVSVNEKRMFKVTCGMSTDMSKVHAAQLKVSTMLGQQVTIEKN